MIRSVTVIGQIADVAAGEGLSLVRCAPRGDDRLVVEFRGRDGRVVAGQWHADPMNAASVAPPTAAVADPGDVTVLDGRLVVQRRGADRKLPVLAQLVGTPGVELVSHRAERRGVVRHGDGRYTKVVPPNRVAEVARTASLYAVARGVALPEVVSVDTDRGTLTTRALPGRTLEARLADRSLSDAEVAGDLFAIGAALRSFHEAGWPPATSAAHDWAAEVAVTRRWLSQAAAFGLLPEEVWSPALADAATMLATGEACSVRVHRDLHDKQLVLAPGRPPGLLDLDLATSGEAALDLANLLTHLELRCLQGRCASARARACGKALLVGYAPEAAPSARIGGYVATTRLRLAAVYSFRRAPSPLVTELLTWR